MRDFFISSFEKLTHVIIGLMMLAVVIMALMTMFSPMGGFLRGLLFLIGGGLYVVVMGGMLYLFLGIYHNTKRTAELLAERKA